MQKKDLVNKKAQSRAALRMFYELQFILNTKGRIGTEEIQAKLSALGFVASKRTIQRDLNSLRDINAPIKSDGHQPQGWSFFSENLLKEVA
jgi:predicted DNA-binding transcriptional regulator YafY